MTDCRKCKYFTCCDLFKQVFYLQKDEYCDEFKSNNEKKTEEETNEESN
jgi:hypothetical protein